jgi:membrane-associated protease RseP (regulator of RpoE activity)
MKTTKITSRVTLAFLAAGLLSFGSISLLGAETQRNTSTVTITATAGKSDEDATTNHPKAQTQTKDIRIKVLESDPESGQEHKQQTWLGLAAEEASEALISQLQLDPGVGLTVTYVAPDSPAAKAGLQKNDVLVEFNGQPLVHPAQLRKLVQVRQPGDVIKLAYYRAGKKETVSATLSQSSERTEWPDNIPGWKDAMQVYQRFQDEWRDHYGESLREQMKNLQHSLGDLHIDREQVQKEIRGSLEAAGLAAEEVLRHATNQFKELGPTVKTLEELAKGWVGVSKDATVTVNTSGSSVRTMVKADDSGTYVIVANPRKHLTAHDSSGKLLFDGEIETPEQQAAVPKEIWQKAEPMVKKMGASKEDPPKDVPPSEP